MLLVASMDSGPGAAADGDRARRRAALI